MDNKKFTYSNLIKNTNLTPLEKFINFTFYTGVYSGKYNFKNTGSMILLNEDQKDLTFDDINNYIYINYNKDQKYKDRDIEILKEKFTNDISNTEIAEKYGLSKGRVSDIIKRLHWYFIKNKRYTNIEEIENIKEERFLFYINIYIEQKKINEDDIIEKCDFSTRLHNALGRAGIKYIKDLKELQVEDLCKMRDIGEKSIIELCDKCKALNIKLDESIIHILSPVQSSSKNINIVDDDNIKKCGFSNGLCNALQNHGIITINDLKSIPLSKINNIKNLGRLRVKELINRCKELNIDLIEDIFIDDCQAEIDEELESEINNIKNKIYNLAREKRALEIENKNLHQKIFRIEREKRALEVSYKELRSLCERYYQIIHGLNNN